jgi:hypothetical protein
MIGQGDVDGARRKFEQLVVQLAHLKHQAIGVLARPGDWGIDAFAGRLDGEIAIWQAKFFLDTVGKSQRNQIRESFGSALKAATERGHTIRAWTLCLPVDLHGIGSHASPSRFRPPRTALLSWLDGRLADFAGGEGAATAGRP